MTQADEKKHVGAAKTSFVKKCVKDATASARRSATALQEIEPGPDGVRCKTRPGDFLSIRPRLTGPHRATGWGLVFVWPLSRLSRRFSKQQSLEVVAFRKGERDRMVGPGAELADDRRVDAGIERRAGDDLAEETGVDAARARKGREQAAGPQQLAARAG